MILRILLCFVFLCGLGAGIALVRYASGSAASEHSCEPTNPKPEKRLRKFEKHLSLNRMLDAEDSIEQPGDTQ